MELRCLCLVGLFILTSLSPTVSAEESSAAFFDQRIAPILIRRCVGCHNGFDRKGGLNLVEQHSARAGGEQGPVLVPGDPESSLFWQRVRDGEMPPDGELTDSEKELLRSWISGGSNWGSDPIDIFRFTTEKRAGRDWWSLQPLSKPSVPDSGVHPIDFFLRQKLEQHQLASSGPADRRTLIRRLSFDLLGLPPDPGDVEQFENDPDPLAYERLVDRMLDSPHYGERWARHWLDVARYGESDGFEYDRMRPDAWRYRDWVIGALNSDMPYDQFAKLQIAGDVLRPDDPSAITATGFLVCGAFDSLLPQVDVMKKIMRQDVLEDFVGTTTQTFLGVTANCARCHDHKFDPISQTDYYRLAAALSGVTHGVRTVPANAQLVDSLRRRLDELETKIKTIEQPVRDRILADRNRAASRVPAAPVPIAEWDFSQASIEQFSGKFFGSAKPASGALELDGKDSYFASEPLGVPLREKTIEVLVQLDSLEQRGGGALSVQTLDGSQFDAIVFGERDPRMWLAGSNSFARTQSFRGSEEQVDTQFILFAIVYSGDGTITGFRNGVPYGQPYQTEGPVEFAPNRYQVLVGLRHAPAEGNRLLRGKVRTARIYDRALTPDEIKASAGVPSDYVDRATILGQLDAGPQSELMLLYERRDELTSLVGEHDQHATYAVVPQAPGTTRLLRRGSPLDEGPLVAPGGLSAVRTLSPDFGSADASDAERRKKLAEWIASEHNPLFARTIVNRLWHYHFGRGFVPTPNDLGFNGGPPSHPELLDWLATKLVENRWSLKSMQRLIVTSQAFRQLSVDRQESQAVDAENRWLWKFTARRLDAEEIRDAMLAVSGQLQTAVGGPPFRDVRPYFHRGSQFYEPIDPAGPEFHRRSIYRMWARGGRSPILDVFDCPDPSATAPVRGRTTTPLQALTMMNHSFALRMSDELARRIETECTSSGTERVDAAFRLVFARAPAADERGQSAAFIAEHGLAAFCRVLFNSNEFLHVE
jgi:hypothetical protein